MKFLEYLLMFVSIWFSAYIIASGCDKIMENQSTIIENQVIILKHIDSLKIKE